MKLYQMPKLIQEVTESPVDKVLAELTFGGQALPYKALRGDSVKLSLGTSIPLFVAEALYIAGAKDYDKMLSRAAEEVDMQKKAEKYDYQKKVDGWLITIGYGLVLLLMVTYKFAGVL